MYATPAIEAGVELLATGQLPEPHRTQLRTIAEAAAAGEVQALDAIVEAVARATTEQVNTACFAYAIAQLDTRRRAAALIALRQPTGNMRDDRLRRSLSQHWNRQGSVLDVRA